MFRGLLPPPPTMSTAYIDLQRKVKEHARKPRVQEFYRICPHAALARINILEACIGKSLDMHERWAMNLGHPSSEKRRAWHTNRIEEALVEIRRLVHVLRLRRFARYLSVVRLQRTMLKLLYQPRQGNVPKISRSLLDETFMALGNGDGDDDG